MECPAPDLPSLWLVLRNKAGCPESLFVFQMTAFARGGRRPFTSGSLPRGIHSLGFPRKKSENGEGGGLRHENTNQTSRSIVP